MSYEIDILTKDQQFAKALAAIRDGDDTTMKIAARMSWAWDTTFSLLDEMRKFGMIVGSANATTWKDFVKWSIP
jgi:hypothetical protein